jgi:hypothetical protein
MYLFYKSLSERMEARIEIGGKTILTSTLSKRGLTNAD